MIHKTLLAVTLLIASGVVFAQNDSGSGQSGASTKLSAATLQEVVVTAEKRREDIQTVPASIVALSGMQLTTAQVQEPMDIARLSPGLSTLNRTADDAPTFAIRGVGTDDFNPISSSGTAVYIDGIYETGPVFLSAPMFDMARVEVLKGPQGTLYGKDATGGAINIISNGPDMEDDNYVTVGYGRWNTVDLRAAGGGEFADGWSARAAVYTRYQGTGFQTDVDTGRHYGQTRQYATRLMLRYASGDTWSELITVHGSQDSSVPSSFEHDMTVVPGCPQCASLFDVIPPSPTEVRVGLLDLRRDETIYGISSTTEAHLSIGDLVVITGYDRTHHFNVDNQDGVPQALYDYTQDDFVQQFYGEARLASREPLFGRMNWLVGTSYSWQRFLDFDYTDQSIGQIGIFENPPDVSLVRGLSLAQNDVVQAPSSAGGFFHTTTDITEKLRFIAGGRFSDDYVKVDGRTAEDGSDDGGVLFHGIGSTIVALDQSHDSRLGSYTAGFDYDIARHVLGYATVSTGTKSGTYYLGPALDPASWRYVRPERLTSYEVGLKSSLLDNRVVLDGDVFYYDYKDRQTDVAFISQVTGSFAASIDNLPRSRIRGAELQSQFNPIAGLTLGASATFLDSQVMQTITNVSGEPLVVPLPIGAALAQSPKWTFDAQAAYRWRVSEGVLASLETNYVYTGRQIDAEGDPDGLYGPNIDLSAQANLEFGDKWNIGLWGKNLTNNRNLTIAFLQIVGRTIYINKPISYGIDVTRNF